MTAPTTDPATYIAGEDGAPYLAVDVLPTAAVGTLVVDDSDVDGPDLLAWGPDGWDNVVCDVQSVAITRGATRLQGALTRTEAGTCTVTLSDTDRRFDPMANADAVHPGTPLRVRAWGYREDGTVWQAVLFTGELGPDYLVTYQQDAPPVVRLVAVDVVAELARWQALGRPDPGVGDGDNLLGRVRRVVTELGMPDTTVAADVDAGYIATLPASNLARGWDEITAAADAELGRVWANAANQLVVRSRGSELTGTVRGTLSDVHGEEISGAVHCCYSDPLVRFGTDMMVNRAIGARRVPRPADSSTPPASAVVQVDDNYSQAQWGGAYVHEDRGLELQTDSQLRPWAETLVLHSATPELRVDEVTPAPRGAPAAWPAVCATDLGDRWYYRQRPALGPAVERTLGVLGVEHTITPAGWTVTWLTTNAPTPNAANPSGWFTVDLSELGGEDVLPAFGGVVP